MARRANSGKPRWPFAVNRDSPQARGLIGWWPMAPAGGLALYNLAPRNNVAGALTNGPAWVPGQNGGHALGFDGSDDYVDLGDAYDMGTSDWTVSGWFRVQGGDADWSIIQKAEYSGASNRWQACWYGAETGAATRLRATFHGTSAVHASWDSSGEPADGNWHHFCSVYDRDGLLRLYFDGVEKASADISAQATVDMQSDFLLLIGRYNDTTGSAGPHPTKLKFAGQIEDVRIYNVALPPAVIEQMVAPSTRYDLYRPWRRQTIRWALVPLRTIGLPASAGTAPALPAAAGTSPTLPGSVGTQFSLTGSY